jgi:hypothetical protein
MEYLIPFLAIAAILVLIYFRFRPKLRIPSTASATPTPAATPTPPAPTPVAKTSTVKWGPVLAWVAGIGVILFLTLTIRGCVLDLNNPCRADGSIKSEPAVNWQQTIQFDFFPNKWDEKNLGWQKVADLEPGEYWFDAAGVYQQYISNYLRPMGPEGWNIQSSSRAFSPLPLASLCAVIGKLDENGAPFLIGKGRTLRVEKPSALWVSLNLPQDWAERDFPASSNFDRNRGELKITVKKRAVTS